MAGSEFTAVLQTGIGALVGFYALGWLVGELARQAVTDQTLAELKRALQSDRADASEPGAAPAASR